MREAAEMKKVFFLSLGCDKNLVDSQMMLGQLSEKGFGYAASAGEADVIVVNTCSFIGDARDESIESLIEMGMEKREGKCRVLIAAGCLAERYREDILKEMPEVDAVLGTASIDMIAETVEKSLKGEKVLELKDLNRLPMPVSRVASQTPYTDYLKIAEGCDKRCSYCVIPSLRGNYRSYPMDYLLAQVRDLAARGVRELILVAQETTLYGIDIYGKKMLPELLREISAVHGVEWIRIMYAYPEEIDEELLICIRDEPKICHYLDIPVQHASDRILRRMGRKTDAASLREIIGRIREIIPDIALRTTLISGFPGETEEDHRILMGFVREMSFERLGVFAYSREEGTPAADMEPQTDENVKLRRRDELMALQQEIAFARADEMRGTSMELLVEGRLPDEEVYVCRSYMDAPDVDGCVFLNSGRQLISGDIITGTVTGARGYDLLAEEED